jgi:hypothetical protein
MLCRGRPVSHGRSLLNRGDKTASKRTLPELRDAPSAAGIESYWWGGITALHDSRGRMALLTALLLALVLGGVVAAAYLGRLRDVLGLIVALLFIPLFLKRPLILVFAYFLFSINLFENLPLQEGVISRLGSGVTFKLSDLMIAVMLLVSLLRLSRRRRPPMFLGLVVIWVVYVALKVLYATLSGEAGSILVMRQEVVGWVLYLALVGLIDSPRDVRVCVRFLFGVMVVAALYQFAEFANGGRILLFPVASRASNYFTFTPYVEVAGARVPYLWNRAAEITVLVAFVATSAVLSSGQTLKFALLAAVDLFSIALHQIRYVYMFVASGLLVVLLLHRWKARSIVRALVLVVLLVALVVSLTPFLAASYGGNSAVSVWMSRAGDWTTFRQQPNVVKRLNDASTASKALEGSWAFGVGWSQAYVEKRGEFGPSNVLLVHGYVGVIVCLSLYLTVLVRAIRLGRGLLPSIEQSLLFGFAAYLIVALPGSALLAGGMAPLAAVFVDRIGSFKADGLLADGSGGGWRQSGWS